MGSALALHGVMCYWICSLTSLLLLSFCVKSPQRLQACIRGVLAFLLGTVSFYLTDARYQFPKDSLTQEGIADVEVTSVLAAKTPFGPVWNYKGNLRSFVHNDKVVAKGFPVRITIPFEKHLVRPTVGIRYHFKSQLKKTTQGGFALAPIKGRPWMPIQHLSLFSEWRFSAKSGVRQQIESSVKDSHIGAFLTGIITGEFDDRLLAFELGRFGLQHLMAISGFHFSILCGLFGFFLSLFFSRKIAVAVLITLMTGYFIFLGDSPSVTRSWIAIVLALGAIFFERQNRALNALGVGLLVVVLFDPLSIQEIGFQFSFGVTASILLWCSPCDRFLQKIFVKRSLSQAVQMDRWDQHGYCFLHWLRQALALCIAVNLIALPLTLYHFHKFPLIGFVYNLFFPPLVSISMLLLLLAMASAPMIPELSAQLHHLNETYTGALLNAASHLPKLFDTATWRITEMESEVLLTYFMVVFILGIFVKNRYSSERMAEPWMV